MLKYVGIVNSSTPKEDKRSSFENEKYFKIKQTKLISDKASSHLKNSIYQKCSISMGSTTASERLSSSQGICSWTHTFLFSC